LKCIAPFFDDVYSGKKNFEVRINDRDYRVDDELILQEYIPINKSFTGRMFSVTVIYVLEGGQYGILPGFVVLGIELITHCSLNMNPEELPPIRNREK
jgi:hypothetical protein